MLYRKIILYNFVCVCNNVYISEFVTERIDSQDCAIRSQIFMVNLIGKVYLKIWLKI